MKRVGMIDRTHTGDIAGEKSFRVWVTKGWTQGTTMESYTTLAAYWVTRLLKEKK